MADKRFMFDTFSLQNYLILRNFLMDVTDRRSEGSVSGSGSGSGSGSSSVVDDRVSLTLTNTTEAIEEAQSAARRERSSIDRLAITQLHLSGALLLFDRHYTFFRVLETVLGRLEPASQTASNALSSDSSGTPPMITGRSSNVPDSVPRLSLSRFQVLPDIAAQQAAFADPKSSQRDAAAVDRASLMNKWRRVSSIANALGSLRRFVSLKFSSEPRSLHMFMCSLSLSLWQCCLCYVL